MKPAQYLLDSVIFIDHLNNISLATDFLKSNEEVIAISVITRAEILSGCPEETFKETALLLDGFPLLVVDGQAADMAAQLRRQYRWKLADAFQAALARIHSLTLVTRNTKDFPPRKHKGVMVPYHLH